MASRRLSPDNDVADGKGADDGRQHGYRLIVLAAGVCDVVESVGGFLCDRARAGWDVSMPLVGPCDARPLAILGIAAQGLDTDVASVIRGLPAGGALAVDADLLTHDAGVRDDVARVAIRGRAEVTVWGRPELGDSGHGLEPVVHPLSVAATAFKMHALLATGRRGVGADSVAPNEPLFRLIGRTSRRLYSV